MKFPERYSVALPILCIVLQGCAAPLVALAPDVIIGAKEVHDVTGQGDMVVKIDDSKVTSDEKNQLKEIKRLAVWPDDAGSSAMFAEALSEGGRFSIVTPSQVSAAMGNQGAYTYNLRMMTGNEVKDTFAKVCQETNAEALISLKDTGQEYNANYFTFDRPNSIHKFTVRIYKRDLGNYVVEIPVEVKTDIGGAKFNTGNEEATRLIYADLAKKIISLAE